MQLRAAFIVTIAVLVPLASACNDDGRTLRPARADQTGSVSTLAPVTDPTSLGLIDDVTDDGLGEDVPIETGAGGSSPVAVSPSSTLAGTEPLMLVSAFQDGAAIDPHYTCEGENISPALSWSAAPTGTIEIAITMADLDVPDFVHWAMAGIDPASQSLGEGMVPESAIVALNGTGQPGYTGPCPPVGETHTYRFTVHYLGSQTELASGATGDDLLLVIEDSTFASAQITGTYSQG
jgi:Raf kinase inhibitor-like YbhB/YbcL family protein